jgi:hypothetical protein
MKIYIAIFFMIYVNHVSAMEPLGTDELDHITTFIGSLKELWKFARTSKSTERRMMNESTYFNHVKKFMKEHYGDNYTCEWSDGHQERIRKMALAKLKKMSQRNHGQNEQIQRPKFIKNNQIYVCESTITHPEIEFTGHPGFEFGKTSDWLGTISSKIEGQAKKHHINDMMVVNKIDGQDPILYALSKRLIEDGELTNYWGKNGTKYTLKFKYDISNARAKNLFQNYKALGLCSIQTGMKYWEIDQQDDKRFGFGYPHSKSTTDAMRYTFDFSKSNYYRPNLE